MATKRKTERHAIVTGASQGIGQAIARTLAARGFHTTLCARGRAALEGVRDEIEGADGAARVEALDLGDADAIDRFAAEWLASEVALDVLVNCGGLYRRGAWDEADPADLALLLGVNVEGPYRLTRALLPALDRANGDVVFVNSSIVRGDGRGTGHFAATQRALTGLADALRAEVNDRGIRVLSVFPGRTATPRQAQLHGDEARDYRPERLLQPEEVATMVATCVDLPETAEVTELHIRPRFKS